MADYSKLTKRELIMTLYARDLMLENERKRLECLTEKYFELKQQLAITEKALELACETLQDINFKLYNTEMNFVDFFKQQAKDMLENE